MDAVAIIFLTWSALAQSPMNGLDDLALRNLKQEGQLVSVQLVWGEPIRIYVVGREEAKFDPTQLALTVRRLKPYPAKVLKLTKLGDYFAVDDPTTFNSASDLEVTTQVKNKKETFHFKLENKRR
jgi:hypothetical protein